MEMLCNWNSFVTFYAGEVQATSAYLCNQQRCQFAKSALHHAPRGLESLQVLQFENQADTTYMSWKQTAKEPNEDSDTESLSSQASPPVLSNIAGYNLAKDNITHVLDVQKLRLWQAIKAEKERKKLLAIEAALRSEPAAVWRIVKLIGLLIFKTYWLQVVSTHIGLARAAAILTLSQLSLSWNLDWTTRLTLPYKCLGWLYWAAAECFCMKP